MYYFYAVLLLCACGLSLAGFLTKTIELSVGGFYLFAQLILAARREWTDSEMMQLRALNEQLKAWDQEEKARFKKEKWTQSTVVEMPSDTNRELTVTRL